MKKYRRLIVFLCLAFVFCSCASTTPPIVSGLSKISELTQETIDFHGQIQLDKSEKLLIYDTYKELLLCGIIAPIEGIDMGSGIVESTKCLFIWDNQTKKITATFDLKKNEYLVASAVFIDNKEAVFSAMPTKSNFIEDEGQMWTVIFTNFETQSVIDKGKSPFYAFTGTPVVKRLVDSTIYLYCDGDSKNIQYGIRRLTKDETVDIDISFEAGYPINLATATQNKSMAFLCQNDDICLLGVYIDGQKNIQYIPCKGKNILSFAIVDDKVFYSFTNDLANEFFMVCYDLSTKTECEVQTVHPITKLAATEGILIAADQNWNTYVVTQSNEEMEINSYEVYPSNDVFMFVPGEESILVNNLISFKSICIIKRG